MSYRKSAMLRAVILGAGVVGAIGGTYSSHAAQFFVSTSGNDSNSGLNGSPWRTLQRAANAVTAGDKVTALPGDYAGFNLTTDGAAGSPIEFFAEPGVNITSANTFTDQDGINLEGASYITIDGFNVADMDRAGVRSVGFDYDFAEHVTIRNVTATNNGVWGIFTGHVDDLLIENNRTSGSIDEHGIYVSNSGDRPIIRNNESFNNRSNGIHMNGDESQGGDGIISNALVSGNIIYNNGAGGGGSGINMDGVQNSRIENNLLYDNHRSGISLYQIDGGGGASGNVVINNTVHQASDGRWALNIQDASINNTVLNNILITDHTFRGAIDLDAAAEPGFESDYNIMISRFTLNEGDDVISLSQWQNATGQDAHSIAVTPAMYADLFADLAADNYQLSATSPARDSGTSQLAPLYDLLKNLRPAGAGFDRGAYEYGAVDPGGGDFDGDGDVDGRDFLAWQRDPAVGFLADWQEFYGAGAIAGPPRRNQSNLSSSVVPEPTSLLLAIIACVVGSHRRPIIAWRPARTQMVPEPARGLQMRRLHW